MLIVKALCSSGPPAGCRRIRYRATAARATSHKTAGRIVFPTQSFGDTLAVHGPMFRARRVEQIHADGLAGLRLPILAALMFGKTQPLIGACSYASIPGSRVIASTALPAILRASVSSCGAKGAFGPKLKLRPWR